MSTNFKPSLPSIFPQEEVKVKEEQHRYNVFEGQNGELEEKEYVLKKAPIDEIVKVTGISEDKVTEFEKGTDYELGSDKEKIIWQDDPATRPDAGTLFYVTYYSESILSRYLEASEEELESVNEDIEKILSSKFVDKAEGDELDRLGELFGTLGKRNERTDTQYRIYLKSVVQSFISRGTQNGIKTAVSAATDVPVDDITINENFKENEYELVVIPNNPVSAQVIQNVADIADPSGINQIRTRFTPEEDITGVTDASSFKFGTDVSERLSLNDEVAKSLNDYFEHVASDDDNAVNDGKNSILENQGIDDTASGKSAEVVSDEQAIDDDLSQPPVKEEIDKFKWQGDDDETTWDFFEWTQLIELSRDGGIDELSVSDSIDVPPTDGIVSDGIGITDSVTITISLPSWNKSGWNNFKWTKEDNSTTAITEWNSFSWDNENWAKEYSLRDVAIQQDQTGFSDTASIGQKETTIETAGVTDSKTTTVSSVAWESTSWNSFDWAASDA